MGAEIHPLLLYLAERCKGEYLETARIGKDIVGPGGELVKAPCLLNNFYSRPQIEMIGVPQYKTIPHVRHILMLYSLDAAVGSHRHIYRGLDSAVGQNYAGAAGFGSCTFLKNCKFHLYLSLCIGIFKHYKT